mmetsp:Transcript_27439/g.44945  ORF Transcript_27439/g.44945 Transcript_27439/m.44945 type:complete len:288 (-) Transcript_27439:198-1061(-)
MPAVLVEAGRDLVLFHQGLIPHVHAHVGVTSLAAEAAAGTLQAFGLHDLQAQLSSVEDLFPLHPAFHVRRIRQGRHLLAREGPRGLHVEEAFAVHLGKLLAVISGGALLRRRRQHRQHVALGAGAQRAQGRQKAFAQEVVLHVSIPNLKEHGLPHVQRVHEVSIRLLLGGIRDGHIQVDGNSFRHILGAVVGGGELPQGLTQQWRRAEAIHELLLGELKLAIGGFRIGFHIEVQLHRASTQPAIGIHQDAAVEPLPISSAAITEPQGLGLPGVGVLDLQHAQTQGSA